MTVEFPILPAVELGKYAKNGRRTVGDACPYKRFFRVIAEKSRIAQTNKLANQ